MSNLQTSEFLFIWEIENYSYAPFYDRIQSPTFKIDFLSDNLWTLYFDNNKDEISIGLLPSEKMKKTIRVLKIEMLGAKGEVWRSQEKLNSSFRDVDWQFDNFIKRSQLAKNFINYNCDFITIRCFMTLENRMEPDIEYKVRTMFGVDYQSVEWRECISKSPRHRISKLLELRGKVLHIFIFKIDDNLVIKIKENENNSSEVVTCKVSFVDDTIRHEQFSEDKQFAYSLMKSVTGFPTCMQINFCANELPALKSNSKVFEFVLKFEVSASNGINVHKEKEFNASFKMDSFSVLHDDLRKMFTHKKHSDVKLKVDNKLIPAHKSLLAARSPVFSAMFDQDMVENQTGVVVIQDVGAEISTLFLEFIYTGTISEMKYKNALELLIVSDKYEVLSLNEKCSSFLKSSLSIENACEVINIADLVGHTMLKEAALAYIQENAAAILSSPKWIEFIKTNVELVTYILSKLSESVANKALN